MTFEFRYDLETADKDFFVIHVPKSMDSKEQLLASISGAGIFPSYFGYNWDALQDCLCDFTWIEAETIIITHADLPLKFRESECSIYLDILQTSVLSWRSAESPRHVLRVIFPPKEETYIKSILK